MKQIGTREEWVQAGDDQEWPQDDSGYAMGDAPVMPDVNGIVPEFKYGIDIGDLGADDGSDQYAVRG